MAQTVLLTASRKPRRRLAMPPHLAKHWRIHAHRAGEIVAAWNNLQAGCFLVFESLTDGKTNHVAYGIWHTIQSDNTQREMMLAAAKAVLGTKSRAYLQVKWLKDKADDMAKFRNDPAHTPMNVLIIGSNPPEIRPNVFVGREQAINRLQATPLAKTWRKIRGDLFALASFAEYLSLSLLSAEKFALPRRPRLLSVPTSRPRNRQRQRGRGKPPNPPRS